MTSGTSLSERFHFVREIHPHILRHRHEKPVKVKDEHVGLNGKIAILVTGVVGTMWCAYIFLLISLVSAPSSFTTKNPIIIVSWISQSFIQLVLLPVIIVGQNIQGEASDKRSEQTYADAEAIFHEANQIQDHLLVQDSHLAAQDARLEQIINALKAQFPELAKTLDVPPTPEATAGAS
ncbi:MAG TPA: hypothetical protein VFB34_04595 [Chloroflexota bacterium]|nr:hypothetical protein [Chloroflexota bacterium]